MALVNLNDMQEKIVNHTEGPCLVLAGAGSGKTKVLISRIANIINSGLAKPEEILAITFTNKAANEMLLRLNNSNIPSASIWAMTFHSMCCRMLRKFANKLTGYTKSFSIYDDTDKKSVVKKILKEQENSDEDLISEVLKDISIYKQSGMSLNEYCTVAGLTKHKQNVCNLISEYEKKLKELNAMDFDDLIIKTLLLLKNDEEVRNYYQTKFKYILVDEFQDTNESQYELIKILGGGYGNVFAVGDEDQSIYSWRGANVANIQRFLKDFSNATLFKLEQNYRSTKKIINSANTIIKNNTNRIDKTLFTENSDGVPVEIKQLYTDRDESDFVIKEIYNLVNFGYKCSDIAILMRLNALTRTFEEKLLNYNIPYKVFGGLKFYDRLEIKNMMAYLKILVNPQDAESFFRVVNFPKRNIGESAIASLLSIKNGNLMDTIFSIEDNVKGTLSKFVPFKTLLLDLINAQNSLSLGDFVEYVANKTGILNLYSGNSDEDINRLENIKGFISDVKRFEQENTGATLSDFLQSISLISDIDSYNENDDSVTLATVHAVKGLEFKVVFVVGLEERIFPIIRADSLEDDMEEERRLMYVAITRAKERLYLTSAKNRYMYGKQNFSVVSRFMKELGYEQPVKKPATPYTQPKVITSISDFMATAKTGNNNNEFSVGTTVFHTKFGVGSILEIDRKTNTANITFGAFGNKVLSLEYAPLKVLKNDKGE